MHYFDPNGIIINSIPARWRFWAISGDLEGDFGDFLTKNGIFQRFWQSKIQKTANLEFENI